IIETWEESSKTTKYYSEIKSYKVPKIKLDIECEEHEIVQLKDLNIYVEELT
ncbi:1257_t:CDS:1, partial [Dentiscutata erythropus]